MKKRYLIIYGLLTLIIAFFLLAIYFAGGHRLYMANPWMFFYVVNFYAGLFISLNCFLSLTKIRKWKYFKRYYSVIFITYILITIISILNFLQHDKLDTFDFVIASWIIITTIIAIIAIGIKDNEIKE